MSRLVLYLRQRISALLSTDRVLEFGVAGASGMIVDNLVLVLLVSVASQPPVASKLVAAEIAIIVSFSINERYTYDPLTDGVRALGRRLVKSHLVRAAGVTVAVGTLYMLNQQFGIWYLFANLAGIGISFFFNYTAESLFTWRVHINE